MGNLEIVKTTGRSASTGSRTNGLARVEADPVSKGTIFTGSIRSPKERKLFDPETEAAIRGLCRITGKAAREFLFKPSVPPGNAGLRFTIEKDEFVYFFKDKTMRSWPAAGQMPPAGAVPTGGPRRRPWPTVGGTAWADVFRPISRIRLCQRL